MDHPELQSMYSAFKARREIVVDRLDKMPGVNFVSPKGAFYIFVDLRAHLGEGKIAADSNEFCLGLLEEFGVAAVPGDAFGTPGCIRLSYARPVEEIEDALDRLSKFLETGSKDS
jgi:aspartate aminotransferase